MKKIELEVLSNLL